MIPLRRPAVGATLAQRLARHTEALRAGAADAAEARRVWRGARVVRGQVQGVLEGMAAGLARCMYCGDSQGTSVDHFQPLALAPARAFDWVNHFLACAHCNSNAKRDQYPCSETGECLLIRPQL